MECVCIDYIDTTKLTSEPHHVGRSKEEKTLLKVAHSLIHIYKFSRDSQENKRKQKLTTHTGGVYVLVAE